jgi:hypothetical protein
MNNIEAKQKLLKQHVECIRKRTVSQLVLNYDPCGKQHWKNSKILIVGDFDDDGNGRGYDNDDETTVMTKTV